MHETCGAVRRRAAVLARLWLASASAAAPEYGRCVKAEKVGKEYKGRFSNSGCTTEVPEAERAKKGKYEWHPGAVKVGQTSSGGKGVLEEVGKYAVGCCIGVEHGRIHGHQRRQEHRREVQKMYLRSVDVHLGRPRKGRTGNETARGPAGVGKRKNEEERRSICSRKEANCSSNSTAKANCRSR